MRDRKEYKLLSEEFKRTLKQGDKVVYLPDHRDKEQRGVIEIDEAGRIHICGEHNYKNGVLTDMGKAMQYYNPIDMYGGSRYAYFKVVN